MVRSYSIVFAAAVALAATPSLAMDHPVAGYDVSDYSNEVMGRELSDVYVEAREPEFDFESDLVSRDQKDTKKPGFIQKQHDKYKGRKVNSKDKSKTGKKARKGRKGKGKDQKGQHCQCKGGKKYKKQTKDGKVYRKTMLSLAKACKSLKRPAQDDCVKEFNAVKALKVTKKDKAGMKSQRAEKLKKAKDALKKFGKAAMDQKKADQKSKQPQNNKPKRSYEDMDWVVARAYDDEMEAREVSDMNALD